MKLSAGDVLHCIFCLVLLLSCVDEVRYLTRVLFDPEVVTVRDFSENSIN